jgi:Cof subfamily protein (haloacid dehalogenase superfamily)
MNMQACPLEIWYQTMNETKILFTDLDGTLLNDQKQVSYDNRQAIQKALKRNHKIVIATGRPLPSAVQLIEDLELTSEGCYAITYNGGLIYDSYHKKAIFKTTLPFEYVQYIFDKAKEKNIHCHTYSDEYVISEKVTRELELYCGRIKVPYSIVEDIHTDLVEKPVKVIMVDLAGRKRLTKIKEELASWCQGKVNCNFSNAYFLEFGSLEATKGTAVRYLCNYLNIPIENSIAAGDEENDISMIQAAGIGAVMANAPDEIKKLGDYITKHNNNNHGIAEIIEKFL